MKLLNKDGVKLAVDIIKGTEPDEVIDRLWAGEGEWPGVRQLYRVHTDAQPRINAHIAASHRIPTLEGLRSSDAIDLAVKADTFRTIAKSLIRFDTIGDGTDDAGRKWDAGLAGVVPSGQVSAPEADDKPTLTAPARSTTPAVAKPGNNGHGKIKEVIALPDDHPLVMGLKSAIAAGDEDLVALFKKKIENKLAEIAKERAAAEAVAKATVDVDKIKSDILSKVDAVVGEQSLALSNRMNEKINEIKEENKVFTDGISTLVGDFRTSITADIDIKINGFINEAGKTVESAKQAAASNAATINELRNVIAKVQESVSRIPQQQAKAAVNLDPDEVKKITVEILNQQVKDIIGNGGGSLSVPTVMTDDDRLASAVIWPGIDPTFYFEEEELGMLIGEMAKSEPQNVLLEGPQGCGKSTWPFQLAARLSMPIIKLDCATMKDERAFFGFRDPVSLKWIRSALDIAIERGGHVILFDEISRCTPRTANGIFGWLDHNRRAYIDERGSATVVGPGTIFCATRNVGNEFTGTMTMDAALNDRFTRRIKVNYLPPDKEIEVIKAKTLIDNDDAVRLVELANDIRAKASGGMNNSATLMSTVSTRQLVGAAKDFRAMRQKFQNEYAKATTTLVSNLCNHFDKTGVNGASDSDWAQVSQMVQAKFGAFSA